MSEEKRTWWIRIKELIYKVITFLIITYVMAGFFLFITHVPLFLGALFHDWPAPLTWLMDTNTGKWMRFLIYGAGTQACIWYLKTMLIPLLIILVSSWIRFSKEKGATEDSSP